MPVQLAMECAVVPPRELPLFEAVAVRTVALVALLEEPSLVPEARLAVVSRCGIALALLPHSPKSQPSLKLTLTKKR